MEGASSRFAGPVAPQTASPIAEHGESVPTSDCASLVLPPLIEVAARAASSGMPVVLGQSLPVIGDIRAQAGVARFTPPPRCKTTADSEILIIVPSTATASQGSSANCRGSGSEVFCSMGSLDPSKSGSNAGGLNSDKSVFGSSLESTGTPLESLGVLTWQENGNSLSPADTISPPERRLIRGQQHEQESSTSTQSCSLGLDQAFDGLVLAGSASLGLRSLRQGVGKQPVARRITRSVPAPQRRFVDAGFVAASGLQHVADEFAPPVVPPPLPRPPSSSFSRRPPDVKWRRWQAEQASRTELWDADLQSIAMEGIERGAIARHNSDSQTGPEDQEDGYIDEVRGDYSESILRDLPGDEAQDDFDDPLLAELPGEGSSDEHDDAFDLNAEFGAAERQGI